MKFGVFYEMQLPKPWLPGDEKRLFHEALAQVELADRLGYDHAWEVEHHFLDEYSHLSASEAFMAFALARTKNIHIGSGIINITPNVSPPSRVAEKVAMLDHLGQGRFE
jgi:alkanesulfonate monooxygenase SsuD/methylene tetrahydromethanopterin reductase-like flavin-dependent oxidoreductase (luciferase family)